MKTCSKCGIEKNLDCFSKDKSRKTGYSYVCKECVSIKTKKWAEENKEKVKANSARWYVENKEKHDKRNQLWRKVNTEKSREYTKKWANSNKDKEVARHAKRRAACLNRTPSWADHTRIKAYYNVCSFFNEINGHVKYHVDHIIPLQGKLVSGLHVHNNLQILLARDNLSKSNKY